jgi:hypothetical protein
LGFPYEKGDIVTDQGAAWIYISDAAWDGTTEPPTLPVQENAYWRQIKDATASSITVTPPTVSIKTDYLYAPIAGETPRLGQAKYLVGAADVTSATTWSISATSGCTVTISSTGGWEVTATSSVNPYFDITGVYGGITLVKRVPITTIPGDPPAGSGGGSGSSSATISSGFPTIGSSGTYPTDPEPIATVESSSTGKLEFGGGIYYSINPALSGYRNAWLGAKIVYRVAGGGSWTDVTSELVGDEGYAFVDPEDYAGMETYDGSVYLTPTTVTGLTASTDYEFGVKMRRQAGNATVIYPYGSITATQVA